MAWWTQSLPRHCIHRHSSSVYHYFYIAADYTSLLLKVVYNYVVLFLSQSVLFICVCVHVHACVCMHVCVCMMCGWVCTCLLHWRRPAQASREVDIVYMYMYLHMYIHDMIYGSSPSLQENYRSQILTTRILILSDTVA